MEKLQVSALFLPKCLFQGPIHQTSIKNHQYLQMLLGKVDMTLAVQLLTMENRQSNLVAR